MSWRNVKARLIQSIMRDPLCFLLAGFSLYPVYFQFARIDHRVLGSVVSGAIFVSLVLSQPPFSSLMSKHRLRVVVWSSQSITFLYWSAVVMLIIAYARCVLIPFYFIGLPILALALIPRAMRFISYKTYLLLLSDLFIVMTFFMFTFNFWELILSHIGQPPYLREVIGTSNGSLSCKGNAYKVEEPPVWMRRVHLYENDRLITATNGYEFLPEKDKNIAGIVARRSEEGCTLRWYYGTFSRDMIYDKGRSVYFTSQFFDSEILALDEHLSLVKRRKLTNTTMDLFLYVNSKGEEQLLAVSFLEGKLFFLDPSTLDLISERVYSPLIANCNFIRMCDRKKRLYCCVISWGYIAALVDIESPDHAKRGVWGIASWGIDFDPYGNYFYVSDFFLGRVYKVDEGSMKVVAHALLHPGIRSVVFDPRRKYIYVGDYYLKDVFVLDENLREIARLHSNGRLTDMALSQDGNFLYTIGWIGVYAIDLNAALGNPNRGTSRDG